MTGDLTKTGLPRPVQPVWRSDVEEWDRALGAANKPEMTRYNFHAEVQLIQTNIKNVDTTRSKDIRVTTLGRLLG